MGHRVTSIQGVWRKLGEERGVTNRGPARGQRWVVWRSWPYQRHGEGPVTMAGVGGLVYRLKGQYRVTEKRCTKDLTSRGA